MNKFKKIYRILILITFILLFTYTTAFGETLENLQVQKEELINKIDDDSNQLSSIQDNIIGLNKQLEKLNEQIAKYQDDLNEATVKIAQTQIRISDITKELEKTTKKYTYQKKLLEQRVVAIYEAGDTLYLDVLLSSTSIEDFLSKFYYLSKIVAYDQNLIKEVENVKIDIENKKFLLQKELQQFQKEKEDKEKLLITFENTKIIRNSYLNELTEKELEFQKKIKGHEEDIERLEKEILEATLANISEEYIGGEFAWPTPGYTTITSGYGMRIHPIFLINRLHTGVDIGAPKATPIIAVNDGIVTLATYNGSYGYYVMVDHGGGIVTLYAHGSKILVNEGQKVKKGDEIMLVGSTGWSTGDHLHFEVRIDGQTYDPLPYITSNKMPSTNKDENVAKNKITENETNSINQVLMLQ